METQAVMEEVRAKKEEADKIQEVLQKEEEQGRVQAMAAKQIQDDCQR